MQDLTVTIIQADLVWENVSQNLSQFDAKIKSISEQTDLIILPEMFSTGFSMNAKQLAEEADGSTINWLREKSAKKKVDLAGSVIIKEHDSYFNRLYWAKPNGKLFFYDKRHLFRMAKEHEVYSAGNENIIVKLKGWRIRPFICYDLRFPVWSRNLDNQYDMAVYIANWPEKRAHHWRSLLLARAIENQAYVIGVNRVGKDGLGVSYSGDSMIIDPIGNILVHKRKSEAIHTEQLSYLTLENFHKKFPAWMDGDRFEVLF